MRKKVLLAVLIIILLAVAAVVASLKYNGRQKPPVIKANFVDPDIVKSITKFRSCSGHTQVPKDGREMKRSMKHYFTLRPEYDKENFVEIYAPYDGYIAILFGKEEIWVAEKKPLFKLLPVNLWMFGVTHVKPREGLSVGDKVKAGEVIGYGTFSISQRGSPTFDVLYATISMPPKRVDKWTSVFGDLDSVFNHMSPQILREYGKRGVTLGNMIISREERDSDPCDYIDDGPYFEHKGSNEAINLHF